MAPENSAEKFDLVDEKNVEVTEKEPGPRVGTGTRGGVFFKLLVFLVVVFAFAALAWMLFLPMILTNQLRKRSGFDATIQRLAVNPVSGTIELRGFVLTNPPTFPEPDFIELREFSANAQIASLFSDRLIFDRMVVNVANVMLVKRADGTTNAEALDANLTVRDSKVLMPKTKPARRVLIHQLDLRIDRLVVADYTLRRPSRREFTLNLKQTYADVTELDQLFAPAVLKTLAPVATAIGGLIPGDVGKAFGEAGKSGADLLQEAKRKTETRVKGFFDALEESKKP